MNWQQWIAPLLVVIGSWLGFELGRAQLCDDAGQPYVMLPKREYQWLIAQAAKAPTHALDFDKVLIKMGAEGFPKRGDSPCKD